MKILKKKHKNCLFTKVHLYDGEASGNYCNNTSACAGGGSNCTNKNVC